MAKVEHNSEVEAVIKQNWYPEGSALMRDRQVTAETVFKPSQVDKWLEAGVNRTDLEGFDTRAAREPSQKKIASTLYKRYGVGYVESDPERFMHPNHVTRRLLEDEKGRIADLKSFREAVQTAWDKDKSLKNLLKNMTDGDYEALFNTRDVQQWVNRNSSEFIIQGLMQKLNIERGRAEAAYMRLNDEGRQKVMRRLVSGGSIRFTRQQAEPEPTPRATGGISQRSRGGREYTRSKPAKWTDLQLEFLRSNRGMPRKAIYPLYNATFRDRRSPGSINTKMKRMGLKRPPTRTN